MELRLDCDCGNEKKGRNLENTCMKRGLEMVVAQKITTAIKETAAANSLEHCVLNTMASVFTLIQSLLLFLPGKRDLRAFALEYGHRYSGVQKKKNNLRIIQAVSDHQQDHHSFH